MFDIDGSVNAFGHLLRVDETDALFLFAYFTVGPLVVAALWALSKLRRNKRTPATPHKSGRARAFGLWFIGWLAATGIRPNQVTWIGLALVLAQCGAFLIHRNHFWLGTGLALSYLFDALDGVVARAQGRVTPFGGYLDAVTDRYQEIATYLVLAYVDDLWVVMSFVMTGSLMTSYNKARAGLEIEVDNKGWPDLLERPKRLWLLCVALIGEARIPWLLPAVLILLAVLTHFTALQRFVRAKRLLTSEPA